ncbi:MAG: alanine racemase [Pseudomonadota bacterium]
MTRARLTIDLDAIVANWRALNALTGPATRTGAVVKANAYGLGAARVAAALATAGAADFYVAIAEEARTLRAAIGPGPAIYVFAGYTGADRAVCAETGFRPLLNTPEQIAAFAADFPGAPCGLQLDSGMNRLGLEAEDLAAADLSALHLTRVVSHLASADDSAHPQNAAQIAAFARMTAGFAPDLLSLAATAGILLGPAAHFAHTRPGIGLYGGSAFAGARPAVALDIPVIQIRSVAPAESVGYGAAWTATRATRVATISAGYADGIFRNLGSNFSLFAGTTPCPAIGRVSMDLITVDVTGLPDPPDTLGLFGAGQTLADLAATAGTIPYEILTALGPRYERVYKGG